MHSDRVTQTLIVFELKYTTSNETPGFLNLEKTIL